MQMRRSANTVFQKLMRLLPHTRATQQKLHRTPKAGYIKLFQNPISIAYSRRGTCLYWFNIVCFLFACGFVAGCENDEAAIAEWTKKVALKEEGKDVDAFFSQNGTLKAKLHAPVMIRAQEDTVYTEFPKTLHVDFYDSLARRESWLDARYGNYYENLNKVLLRDSVVVINTKGDTLKTAELWWDQNSKKFYTDKPVVYNSVTRSIKGSEGMEASQDLTDVVFKQTTGRVLVSDNY
jgi:LPS export ABC transporter protein LptC